ncbi:glycoside hydrolase family 13 protein [Arthrobacter pigmenti]
MTASNSPQWWTDAVIYQIYPRSFADSNSDGMGDLAGITDRLPYLAWLGVDAIWLSPFYVSPQADAGYDVADYRDVDPLFGTLDDFDTMLSSAHERDIRVIIDLVPNHTSDQHTWFRDALISPTGSAARDRYIFRDGKDQHGGQPPNNWQSVFGGPAWTQLSEDDDSPNGSQWYLHLFDTKQPDLNWENPEVRQEMVSVLRFWLDRGIDGFRIDVAHGLIKAEGLPDWNGQAGMVKGESSTVEATNVSDKEDARPGTSPAPNLGRSPMFDQDGVHDIYREWNNVLTEYPGRMLVAEAWVEPPDRLARYIRPDEMQQAFNFDFLLAGWDAQRMAKSIDESLKAASMVGSSSTWVLSNHDTIRHTSRFGLSNPTTLPAGIGIEDEQPDDKLGLARARAASLIMMALPGSAYIYQGEELGLPEHTTLNDGLRQDPSFFRTMGKEAGRDGCRVPLPWKENAKGYGFGEYNEGTTPWLPQPDAFKHYAVDQQMRNEDSTLNLYRSTLALRARQGLGNGRLVWSSHNKPDDDVLSFWNGPVLVLVNLGTEPIRVPKGYTLMLQSESRAISDTVLAPNTAIWLMDNETNG